MTVRNFLYLTMVFWTLTISSQNSKEARDSINRYTQLDFLNMKEKLGIKIDNRPGPSGNPDNPNAANTNEALVKPYNIPNPLITKKGKRVTTKEEWWKIRRGEIANDFEREMYGFLPTILPEVTWTVKQEKDTMIGPYPVREKHLIGKVDNSTYPEIDVKIELLIGIPMADNGPVPLVMEFGYIQWPFGTPPAEPKSYFASPYEPRWKQQLISQHWGYAILVPSSIQDDNGAGLTSGIIGLLNQGRNRKPEDWGVLRAWAWGAGKALDYFETDPTIDARKIAIEGTSRYGKAALVTMAFDQRFSMAFIGSAGAGGSSLLRRNFGEMTENLASSGEYHWFCGNFIKYASTLTVTDLPVDAHELIALCAPRPVFISAGSALIEGNWVDAKGMFLAGVHASPVYRLLGKNGLHTNKFPLMGNALTTGEIAYRQHAGGHSTGPNWSTWIAWAHRYWD
ncbi:MULTISPECIES: glucuronyl esterase domain-containing protein [Arenibacter]|uniref:glucuronyl esterase domain-containing protein n=1 Tax=Arenibacter TaxID=178469 RepID=UPI0004DF3EBF|nr:MULTISPECIES: hypothetical protein [Arenibacter]GBF20457.1 hypothetical protein C21_02629 [Arenibacter sp. NBRC 103722]